LFTERFSVWFRQVASPLFWPHKEAKDVKVTSVTSDDQVATSAIRFKTDGSNDVLVIIDGGNDTYPDPARKGREGSKGIPNAFEIDQSE